MSLNICSPIPYIYVHVYLMGSLYEINENIEKAFHSFAHGLKIFKPNRQEYEFEIHYFRFGRDYNYYN